MANIKLNNNEYPIPDSALAGPIADFIAHLGTIAGNGMKVVVGGVEYGIDSTKVAGAVADIEAVLGGLDEERLEGDGAEYYTLAPTALSFRSTAPLNELQEIQINGVTVDPSNYTLEEGSTIVTFPIDYLKTLDVGSYEVAVASDSKTVKGDFTVAAPELNEYGFYYNQPYVGYMDYHSSDVVFFLREDGIADCIILIYNLIESCSYTISGNTVCIATSMGNANFTVSDNGTEMYCVELATTFKLGDESIVADEDYIYTYKEDLGGYEVQCIDKTKSSYGAIKTGINDIDTVKMVDYMFENNTNLVIAPVIPDSITSIQCYAFRDCSSLTSITIPDSIVTIEHDAFRNCKKLSSVIIPDSVTSLESGAFSGCNELLSINIPDGVTIIDTDTFDNCVGLTSIVIPVGVTSIGVGAFKRCTGLKSIVIPDSVTTIYDTAFNSCTSLTSIEIPASTTTIWGSPFQYCSSLTSITVDNANKNYHSAGNCLIETESSTLVSGCKNSIIPTDGSVTEITPFAFQGCTGLISITIPDSVTSIGGCAFRYCTGLTSITFEGTTAQWNAITKDTDWNYDVPATYVQCSDGQVSLV